MFGVKFILTLAIPDTPAAVKNAKTKVSNALRSQGTLYGRSRYTHNKEESRSLIKLRTRGLSCAICQTRGSSRLIHKRQSKQDAEAFVAFSVPCYIGRSCLFSVVQFVSSLLGSYCVTMGLVLAFNSSYAFIFLYSFLIIRPAE